MRATAAAFVALGAFLLYRATLLPGFDLGDTASFQTMGGLPKITPRDAYPLYYAIARPIVPLVDNHAYAMNLLSAVAAALACGMIVLVAFELCGSLLAAVAAALLFAGSYTFWSQAVIAEVYSLHLLLVASTLLLLLRWSAEPTFRRLVWFLAAYALAFGNHLSTILLLPAYAVFLLSGAAGGWRSLLSRRVVAAAVGCAALGALQYTWNFSALWREVVPPASFGDALRTFWFDVTKADWRETMVLEVPAVAMSERLRMYAFDLAQQFGWVPPLAAVAGLFSSCSSGRRSHSRWVTTSATRMSSSCPRTSSSRFWRRSASSPGSGPSGRDSGLLSRSRSWCSPRGTSRPTIQRSTGARIFDQQRS